VTRLGTIIDIIATLYCACKSTQPKAHPPTSTLHTELLDFPAKAYDMLFKSPKKVIQPIIKSEMNIKALIRIATHHCWESPTISKDYWMYNIIFNGIRTATSRGDVIKPYMQLFMGLLDIEDSVVDKRTEDGVGLFFDLLYENKNLKDTFEKLVNVLGKLFEKKRFRQCIMNGKHKSTLTNVLQESGFTITKPE